MTNGHFPFKTALNASTLFPFELDIAQQVQVAAAAGYEGFEIWIKDLDVYLANGGNLGDLRRSVADAGIEIVNAIAFFRWADMDVQTREAGFAQAEREMRLLAELGCPAVAAPPFGDVAGTPLEAIAHHYARLSDLGRRIGVEPYLEFWGRAPRLSRLSEAMYVAMASGVANARMLLDPFHMYAGGSTMASLTYLKGGNIGIVHVNDYPANPDRSRIADSDRVFPGDGVAPTQELARLLNSTGYHGYLSLELFRDNYGDETALHVARRGLSAIQRAYTLAG